MLLAGMPIYALSLFSNNFWVYADTEVKISKIRWYIFHKIGNEIENFVNAFPKGKAKMWTFKHGYITGMHIKFINVPWKEQPSHADCTTFRYERQPNVRQ